MNGPDQVRSEPSVGTSERGPKPPTKGACVWLTGRSGAGKSTLTAELVRRLEGAGRIVTVLDVVPELRKLEGETSSRGKLLRKAFVSREVVRHGGIAICVTISAGRGVREQARATVGPESFFEVYVHAPADVSESRRNTRPTRPPLIKRVRRDLRRRLRDAAGRSGGYDVPTNPALAVDTTTSSPDQAAGQIFELLVERGIVTRPVG